MKKPSTGRASASKALDFGLVSTDNASSPSPAPQRLRRRQWLQWAGVATLGAALPGCAPLGPRQPHTPSPRQLRLLGESRIPYRQSFQDTTVGGLSGLDYHPGTGQWVAISDDRSDRQAARFYTLNLDVSAQGLGDPQLLRSTPLLAANGLPYPGRQHSAAPGQPQPDIPDPEAIRYRAETGTLLWTSEGDVRLGLSPALREISLDGRHLRDFTLPDMLRVGNDPARGPRKNQCFEGLALTPNESHAWVAMEGPLLQDGPEPRVGQAGGPVRLTRFDLRSGRADRQIAYVPDALPHQPIPPGAPADNGLSEILMLNAHEMLVLERAYMSGVGLSLALYRIDTRQASNTLDQPTLQAGRFEPARKTLVADFSQLGISRLDNTEGMCWGPTLPNGHRTLVFVSDDNFNPLQITQFLAFEYLDPSLT